jgi:hypothetical protein
MTRFIEGILEKNKDSMLEYKDFEDTKMFALENYLFVLQGNGILNLDPYLYEFQNTYSDEENKNYELFKIRKSLAGQYSANWQEMLEMVKYQYDADK